MDDPVDEAPVRAGAPVSASRHWIAFFMLATGIVIADQVAKAWVVSTISFGSVVPVVGDYVRIWPVHNTGALFGLFPDQAILFAALSIGVVALIVWFHGQSVVTNGWFATLALGLLLGAPSATSPIACGWATSWTSSTWASETCASTRTTWPTRRSAPRSSC